MTTSPDPMDMVSHTLLMELHAIDKRVTLARRVHQLMGQCMLIEIPVQYERLYLPDFSVVLFRPHCMLASEEHPMKVHKNQWLSNLLSPPDVPRGATNQGTHPRGWGAGACAVT